MTGAYDPRALTDLDGPVKHRTIVTIYDVDKVPLIPSGQIEVLGGTLTLDEEWSPFIQLTLTITDTDLVDYVGAPFTFDPRARQRIGVSLGYEYPDGQVDYGPLILLVLTGVERDAAKRTIELTAMSDEILVQQSGYTPVVDLTVTYPSYAAAIQDFIARALSPLVGTYEATLTGTDAMLTNYLVKIGDSWWDHVRSVADAAGGEVWVDVDGYWQITPVSATVTPTNLLTFTTGHTTPASGVFRTLTETYLSESVDQWANVVVLVHQWRNSAGTVVRVAQRAQLTGAPYGVDVIGYRLWKDDRATPISQAACAAACATILGRTQRRGMRRQFTSARSTYWLKPRDRVQVEVNGGPVEQWRATRVTFELDGSGLMTVAARAPEV